MMVQAYIGKTIFFFICQIVIFPIVVWPYPSVSVSFLVPFWLSLKLRNSFYVSYIFLFVSACSSNKICMGWFSLCQGVVTMYTLHFLQSSGNSRAESPFRSSRQTRQDCFPRKSFSNMVSRRRLKFHIRRLMQVSDQRHHIKLSNFWWRF